MLVSLALPDLGAPEVAPQDHHHHLIQNHHQVAAVASQQHHIQQLQLQQIQQHQQLQQLQRQQLMHAHYPQTTTNQIIDNYTNNDQHNNNNKQHLAASEALAELASAAELRASQVIAMISKYPFQVITIAVIIIYLSYYFFRIAKRPRLIGNKQSAFVKFVNNNLKHFIERRFFPMIYFWGTTPQTALFGYMYGRTSDDKIPKERFERQFLEVSDIQYLMSNVDLSKHYLAAVSAGQLLQPKLLPSPSDDALFTCHQLRKDHLSSCVQLAAAAAAATELSSSSSANAPSLNGSELETNFSSSSSSSSSSSYLKQNKQQLKKSSSTAAASLKKRLDGSSSSSSSADSGVLATPSPASSSVLSLSGDATPTGEYQEDEDEEGASKKQHHKCLNDHGENESCSSSDDSNATSSCNNQKATNEQCNCKRKYGQNSVLDATNNSSRYSKSANFGLCAIDWHKDSHSNYHDNQLVALISAGLTTGSDRKYVAETIFNLSALGFEVCVFIRRGVGGLRLKTPKFFSLSKWRDIEAAIVSIKRQRPNARLVGIGFSFGAVELCRYLAMKGKQSQLDAALLISCPYDPGAGSRNMLQSTVNRSIDKYLAKNLGQLLYDALFTSEQDASQQPAAKNRYGWAKKTSTTTTTTKISTMTTAAVSKTKIKKQRDLEAAQTATNDDNGDDYIEEDNERLKKISRSRYLRNQLNANNAELSLKRLELLPKLKSLVEFELSINSVLQNYPSPEAYEQDSKLQDHLLKIETPTLCLSSEDDFIAPLRLLPLDEIAANKNLCMILTKLGGHMGFIDGFWWPTKPYFGQRIMTTYLKALIAEWNVGRDFKNGKSNLHACDATRKRFEFTSSDVESNNSSDNNSESGTSNNSSDNNSESGTSNNNNDHNHNNNNKNNGSKSNK